MSEVVIKDSAIKLFGRTISLPRNNNNNNNEVSSSAKGFSYDEPAPPEDSSSSFPREVSSTTEHEAETDKEPSRKELTSAQEEDEEASHQNTEELKSPTSSSCNLENPKTPSTERETSILKSSKNGDQSDTTTSPSQDKTLKKPDKVLPCPRCNSMDTKFCYYNNYNVNQPRHFCKNCQRYWTAGGTMRNVPVGAGRRKNKNTPSSLSNFRQIMVPESLQNGSLHGASVLTFGSDSPLSDSMASVLSIAEKTTPNGFHSPNGDEYYDTVMASTLSERRDNATTSTNSREESLDNHKSYHHHHHHHHQGFTPQLCFPGSSSSPWPYPWNNHIMTPSAFCHPVPFYPTQAFWGSMPPPSWSVNYQSAPGSGPNSPTLGKHSRDGDILFQKPSSTDMAANNNNNTVLIPKTLRIDDPTEAAKSSIWSTLGIKNEKGNSLDGGGLFKAFASKGNSDDKKNHVMMVEASPSPMLQANPAALSRSLVFHERT